ncbi:uncharacterized protein VP01_1532g9 [Puccinia sorghi]|uniref:DUF659 domain-containing protein n=1 Tax=Puccinia sorghi TaxID=27349 RepID=A0A0L6VKD7_9BASI|nr:uncharacterized protein VP01_1532g9 [Puccinia sorghi]
MKQKHSKKGVEPPPNKSDPNTNISVVDEDDTKIINNNSKASLKRSWVWNHFKESNTTSEAICQVILKNHICGLVLKKDWFGGTKIFHKYLFKVHKLVDPNSIPFQPLSPSAIETLQTEIIYLIADANLPFSVVESKSFQDLVQLLNEQAGPLVSQLSRQNISNHLSRVYLKTQKLKIKFLAKKDNLSFTQDAWTTNFTEFMGVKVHFIDKDFKMHDLTVSIPHVQEMLNIYHLMIHLGHHTGKNFAKMFYNMLNDFQCLNKLHTITANNVSTNSRMALEIQSIIPSFNMKEKLLGCIAHVINLGAKAGLAILGSIHNKIGTEISMADPESSPHIMSIASLTTDLESLGLDMKTIIKRIHGLSTYVCFSPQQCERFQRVVKFAQPDLH